MRFRIRSIAVAVAASLLLAGCSGIPQSGAPRIGQPVTGAEDPEVQFIADSPQAGATQEQILRGFIDAASSPREDYATAREYLAPKIRSTWNPDLNVIVDEAAQRSYLSVDDISMQLTVAPLAEVNAQGEYTEFSTRTPLTQGYSFTRIKGEWRISVAPDRVILDSQRFDDVFSSYALTFFDPSWTYLVPDLRWFPSRASTGTRIVKALLDGPSPLLAGAVTTAFPEGTALTRSAVPVVGDVAQVDLSSDAFQADEVTLQRMQAQLTGSLTGVSAINSVSITVDNSTENIPAVTVTPPRTDPRALVLSEDGFGFLSSGDALERLPGISDQVEALRPDSVVVNAALSLAAARTADGVWALRSAGTEPLRVDGRPGLVPPSLDPFGYIWSVPGSSPAALVVSRPDGSQTAVETSWPEASSILSLAVSRDGTRVLALVTVGNEPRLIVAGIQRDRDDMPVSLGDPQVLAVGTGAAVTTTWVDDLTVATLTRATDGTTSIVKQVIGGQSEVLQGPSGAVSLVSGTGLRQLRAVVTGGNLAALRTSAWQAVGSGISLIATQLGSPG
ncbi:GerMN domain-containing protein [Mycetocola sp. 2940]|uniref:GerMN domain-containing protein n=1 Tax=Mycetocola sp. 2940 TaxID=3156452 RepID=UPI003396BAA6